MGRCSLTRGILFPSPSGSSGISIAGKGPALLLVDWLCVRARGHARDGRNGQAVRRRKGGSLRSWVIVSGLNMVARVRRDQGGMSVARRKKKLTLEEKKSS